MFRGFALLAYLGLAAATEIFAADTAIDEAKRGRTLSGLELNQLIRDHENQEVSLYLAHAAKVVKHTYADSTRTP